MRSGVVMKMWSCNEEWSGKMLLSSRVVSG